MVRRKKPLLPLAEIVLAHHERWDGGGYPGAMKGESIPKGARMIAVLNAFDNALYRDGKSLETAVQEIQERAGTRFDPRIAEAFLSVPSSMWAAIGKQAAAYPGGGCDVRGYPFHCVLRVSTG
jgi:HD-GYP domain-containing protein (c-di-GMP phosphodiesterase class II)